MWKNKRVLVTGGEGFIGKNLAIRLSELGARVTITAHKKNQPEFAYTSRDSVNVFPCDLELQHDCEIATADQDFVFHCAALSHGAKFIKENPIAMITPNLKMTAHLLDASYANNVEKFVFISSSVVYNDVGSKSVEEHETDQDPPNIYYHVGHMKRYGEVLCRTYCEKIKKPMKTVVVRPGNVYGHGDNFDPELSHVTASMIRRVATMQDPIDVWGDGDDIRDIIYIDDFINGLLLASEKLGDSYCPVNISQGKAISVKQILDILIGFEKYSPDVTFDASKPSMLKERHISNKKALDTLGFAPKHSIEEGLEKTLSWYKENKL